MTLVKTKIDEDEQAQDGSGEKFFAFAFLTACFCEGGESGLRRKTRPNPSIFIEKLGKI
jgi:hypothetical protein